jgi:hypothetical protein
MPHIYIESHGVRLDVEVRAEELIPAVEAILPPGWAPTEEFPEDGHFTIVPGGDGTYDVLAEGSPAGSALTAEVAVHVLDSQIRGRVALLARDQIFVHAGVVAVDGRAIVIPGPSFSGKSTLVAALVSAGAMYYSDEYAVVDEEGLIHPFAKPLSLRSESARWGEYADVESLGGSAATEPARAALIVVTQYEAGAQWAPEQHGPGIGALRMLANAVPARSRAEAAVPAIAKAATGAHVLEGPRGEAEETAALLLAALV